MNPKYSDVVNTFAKLRTKLLAPVYGAYVKSFSGIKIGKKSNFLGWPIILVRQGAKVKIGDNFTATSKSIINPAGVSHGVIISAFGPDARLKIGNRVGISGVSINCWNHIEIHDDVIIGVGTVIWDTDFHPINSAERLLHPNNGMTAPIIIHKNVFIGGKVMILKGVTIGENSVIGAGCVVAKNIPANSIAYGNPLIIKKNS